MKILFIHNLMFHQRTCKQAAERLFCDGIELCITDQTSALSLLDSQGIEAFDLLIAELAVGLPDFDPLVECCRAIVLRIGLSPELPADFTTFAAEDVAEFKHYLEKVCMCLSPVGMRRRSCWILPIWSPKPMRPCWTVWC
jgi:hypothetical protein